MSFKFPIGVATIYKPKKSLVIYFLLLFIYSCTTVNLPKQTKQIDKVAEIIDKEPIEAEKKIEEKINSIK